MLYETTIALTRGDGAGPAGVRSPRAGGPRQHAPRPLAPSPPRSTTRPGPARAARGRRAADRPGARGRSPTATASSSPGSTSSAPTPKISFEGRAAARHHGDAARHRLQHGQPEALVLGEEDRDVGGRVARGQPGVADVAGDADRAVAAPSSRSRASMSRGGASGCRPRPPATRPGQARRRWRDGAQQHGQAAPVQDGADGEEHRPSRAQARARASSRGGDGGRSSAAASGTCTTRGATSGKKRAISRRVKSEQASTARDARRLAATRQAAADAVHGREVVRPGEEREVVHRGHAGPCEGERTGVGGGEEHVDVVAARPRGPGAAPPTRAPRSRPEPSARGTTPGQSEGRVVGRAARAVHEQPVVAVRRPAPEQVAQVAAGARRPPLQLASVDPDREGRADQALSTRR